MCLGVISPCAKFVGARDAHAAAAVTTEEWEELGAKGGVLSEPSFFFRTLPSRAHTSSHMSGPGITWRLCGGLGAQAWRKKFESSEALAELPAVARSAVELHRCCARVSLAAALLSQHMCM